MASNGNIMADAGKTRVRRIQQFQDRWSSYDAQSGLVELSEMLSPAELKKFDLFSAYDAEFLDSIAADVSVASWRKDAVLFEAGSYVDIAFAIVDGHVDIFLESEEGSTPAPIFDAQRTLYGIDPTSLLAPEIHLDPGQGAPARGSGDSDQITFLSSMDFDLPKSGLVTLKAGDLFGEIGALNGWPQSATVRTASGCQLIQIRMPALRAMKKKSSDFKKRVDKIYRERTLLEQLRSAPLFLGVAPAFLKAISQHVELVSLSPGDVLTEQGAEVEALYMVRSGFLKISQRIGEADAAVSYLSKGMSVGAGELLIDELSMWQSSISSVGFSELVRISRKELSDLLADSPDVETRLWETAVAQIRDNGFTRQNLDNYELIDSALQKGLVQGNSMLVIDLDVCTRCDDCMRGCASTHGGRPRFIREGDKFENFMIARSCYHCEDPVCLIGCPTGAIRRAQVGDVVEIDDQLCIGCSNCAMKCPYDAIIMHDTGETWSQDAVPERLRGRGKKVASKCDLCYDSDAGPACVNSCPHSCAFRIGSIEDFQLLLADGGAS